MPNQECTRTAAGSICFTDKGARSWLFRYSVGDRERYRGLGGVSTVSLADARTEAQRCRQMRLQGIDPIEARKAERAAQALAASQGVTFKEAAETLLQSRAQGFKGEKTARDWRQSLKDHAYRTLGALPAAGVATDHVLKVLEPIWLTKPVMAGKLRGRIEAVLDAAKARGQRSGENPARWRGHLDHLLAERPRSRHHPALPCDQIGAFIAKLRSKTGASIDCLEFTILTAARTGNSTVARVREFDFAKAEWACQAETMKMGLLHVVPLSWRALEIAKRNAEGKAPDDLLFVSRKGRPLDDTAVARVHHALGDYRDRDNRKITTHGFRSTFRDWAGDCTAFPEEICQFALAHVKGDQAEAAYRRSTALEKRRELMKAWADYCDQIRPANVANVVLIRAAV